MKQRLDLLLVKNNLAASREKAKAVIMSGIVYVDGQKEDKAGALFDENKNIEIRGQSMKYVSRGGLKLEKAVSEFDIKLLWEPLPEVLRTACFKTVQAESLLWT